MGGESVPGKNVSKCLEQHDECRCFHKEKRETAQCLMSVVNQRVVTTQSESVGDLMEYLSEGFLLRPSKYRFVLSFGSHV